MKCTDCGKSPNVHGITLLRQNAKGVAGIWRCESCNRLPVDENLARDVACIQNALKGKGEVKQ